MNVAIELISKNGDLQLKGIVNSNNSLFYTLLTDNNIEIALSNEIKKVETDLTLVEASVVAIENVDTVLSVIRKSESEDISIKKLREALKLTESEARHILNIELSLLQKERFDIQNKLLSNYLDFLNENIQLCKSQISEEEREIWNVIERLKKECESSKRMSKKEIDKKLSEIKTVATKAMKLQHYEWVAILRDLERGLGGNMKQ